MILKMFTGRRGGSNKLCGTGLEAEILVTIYVYLNISVDGETQN